MRLSCAELTIDQSRQTATASTLNARNCSMVPASATSSSGLLTRPRASIRSSTSTSMRRDEWLRIGDRRIERVGAAAFPQQQDVSVALGRQ